MRKHVEVYRDREERRRRFRYRVWAANGQNVGNPGQSYSRRWSATRAARREHPGLPIFQNRSGPA